MKNSTIKRFYIDSLKNDFKTDQKSQMNDYYDHINPSSYMNKLTKINQEISLKQARLKYYKNKNNSENLLNLSINLN